MSLPPTAYWIFLLATLVVETTLVALLARGERKRAALDGLLLNLVTHPVAWLVLGQPALWFAVEGGALAVEAVGYRLLARRPWSRALRYAAVANLVTAVLGWFAGEIGLPW